MTKSPAAPPPPSLGPFLLERVADVDAPGVLECMVGSFRSIAREPMAVPGFSGARFERLRVVRSDGAERRLVLKRVHLAEDWTARLTGDSAGREALLATDPAFAAVWEIFRCPYLVCAVEGSELALLMDDLSDALLPDSREPLAPEDERRLLSRIAAMHARFAGSPALEEPRLNRSARQLAVLSPRVAEAEARQRPQHPVFERANEGWKIARERLSSAAFELIEAAPREFERWAEGMPRTLLHGDSKVANFARFPDGSVAAFDWSMPLAGPVPIELGYYLAINAKRLSAGRAVALRTYRAAFERESGTRFEPAHARRLADLALVAGAALMLWSKALALARGAPGAGAEWNAYSKGLDRIAAELS